MLENFSSMHQESPFLKSYPHVQCSHCTCTCMYMFVSPPLWQRGSLNRTSQRTGFQQEPASWSRAPLPRGPPPCCDALGTSEMREWLVTDPKDTGEWELWVCVWVRYSDIHMYMLYHWLICTSVCELVPCVQQNFSICQVIVHQLGYVHFILRLSLFRPFNFLWCKIELQCKGEGEPWPGFYHDHHGRSSGHTSVCGWRTSISYRIIFAMTTCRRGAWCHWVEEKYMW